MLKEHLLRSLSKSIRYDGRKLDEFRQITVETGIIKSAEGSARVKIGRTEVLVGVKMGVETPYPDTPAQGNLMVNAELLPLSNPLFESGPPGDQAVELARVVDRGIRESEAIDVKKLCIKEGEKVWSVMIDVCTINDEGNLLDAAALGAIAALKDTKFPKYEDEKVDYLTKTKKSLPLLREPISITVLKIGNYFIVDPLSEEEQATDARLTVAVTQDNNICALQKGGETPFMPEDIEKIVDLVLEKSVELRKKL